MGQERWARSLAERLLADALPTRWQHTQGVAAAAQRVAPLVEDQADMLIAAAWLHDIGYARPLAATGFHPLDGARYLRDTEAADPLLCRLVANHSCAIVEAGRRQHADELVVEFPAAGGLLADALTFCDMTTGPSGEPVDVDTRLSEIVDRHGTGSLVAESIGQARPEIERAARTVLAALRDQAG